MPRRSRKSQRPAPSRGPSRGKPARGKRTTDNGGGTHVVALKKPLRRHLERGHPWIYDQALRLPAGIESGDIIAVSDGEGVIGFGFADRKSPIRFRLLRLGESRPGQAWVRAKARRAAMLRKTHPRLGGVDALRVIHGECDGMPGLVLDWYAGHAVVKYDGGGARALWSRHIDAVLEGVSEAGLGIESAWSRDGAQLRGTTPKEIEIREGAARYWVNVRHGHKTGFFSIQRDNRRYVASLAKDKRVLDLFSYSGGFGVAALVAGATHVTLVDQAKPALVAAEKNAGDTAKRATFVAEDVFEFLENCRDAKERFDLVICDPPSFAPNEQSKPKGLRAYERVNRLAAEVVAPAVCCARRRAAAM